MSLATLNDAELVGESVAGNRDAFGHIVVRYQALICSLAYSATGSLSQSEDLAQDTFVLAWKQLGHLREPAKLRSWLCSIARNLINHALRRDGREPSEAADSLESAYQSYSPEPLPVERAISDEEAEILWRSLERLPAIYREPLILFYREHHSVARVARALDLTEDAVHQRLARGRKMLQQQVLTFVEGALERTKPDKAFTLSVVAALPALATTTKVAVTAAKGSAMAKATGPGAILQIIFKVFLPLAPILSLGGYFGYKMGGDARRSSGNRQSVTTFWRIVVGSLVAFFLLPFLVVLFRAALPTHVSKEKLCAVLSIWMGAMYAVVPAALILWACQRRREGHQRQDPPEETVKAGRRPTMRWVVWGVIGTACLLGFCLWDHNWKVQRLSTPEVRKLAAEGKNKDLKFSILQYQNGHKYFWIKMLENGKLSKLIADVDEATLVMLEEKQMACPTYVQGRDFEIFGWPGRLLVFFCIFILAIGVVILLFAPPKDQPKARLVM